MAKIKGEQKKGGVAVVGGASLDSVFPSRKITERAKEKVRKDIAAILTIHLQAGYDGGVIGQGEVIDEMLLVAESRYQDGWEAGYEQAREDFEH